MGKDVYYFSHDSNARNDPKCSALINDFGAEGYGVFWMLIEILSEQENYKLKKFNKLYEGLSRQLGVEVKQLRSIVEALLHDYELLVEDEKFIWSVSLLRRMQEKERKRQAKVEAGRLGGLKSGVSRGSKKQNEAEMKQDEAVLEANEQKESKVNKSKVKVLIYTPDFELFWNHYPRKKEKQDAFEKWNARLNEKVEPDKLILSAKNYALECQKNNTEERYVKLAKTFLGPKKHYEDYLTEGGDTDEPTGGNPTSKYAHLTKNGGDH